MPFESRVDHPIILGIVGDSASGKTTLAAGIAQILGPDRVLSLCSDDYHGLSRAERRAQGLTALNPEANYLEIAGQHLQLLRSGQPVLKPVYDHGSGTQAPPELVEPREYIIVEGLLAFSTKAQRDCFDVKIYLEPQEDLRVKWKLQRDTSERGYTAEQVRAILEKRRADSVDFIQPQRTFADIVVQFYPPQGHSEETGAHLNVRHTLRPTLPHPDLTPLLDAGAKSGLRLDLKRDIDGKPVDVLEIPGEIDDRRAKAMEDLLWHLIPEARHLRENVGKFTDESNRQAMSHPLALSQLLITYHMVKAALGHHAV
ncbi:phosphoribulokinase [Magnetospira sp. QH-2]|uniref:phosphoribulokinase n=1 Tax=Magnetospira sp. (strain QH-2) TaxID=1288970 RepID=UPI0003E8142A|nr:phosphoribulokinase [Magnetospira sp. QH-2]CCQ73746.1 Phosphoribulokinase [Magnetospira sp. QH-2]